MSFDEEHDAFLQHHMVRRSRVQLICQFDLPIRKETILQINFFMQDEERRKTL